MSNTTLKEKWGWLNKIVEPIGPYELGLLFVGLASYLLLGGSTLGLCIFVFTGCASGVLPGRVVPWVLVSTAFLACAVILYLGTGAPGPLTADLDYHQFNGRAHSNLIVFFAATFSLSFYAGSLAVKVRIRQTFSSVLALAAVVSIVAGAFAFYLPHMSGILEAESVNIQKLLDRYSEDMSEIKGLVPDTRNAEGQAVTDRFNADFLGRRYEVLDDDAK